MITTIKYPCIDNQWFFGNIPLNQDRPLGPFGTSVNTEILKSLDAGAQLSGETLDLQIAVAIKNCGINAKLISTYFSK